MEFERKVVWKIYGAVNEDGKWMVWNKNETEKGLQTNVGNIMYCNKIIKK